MTSDLLRHKLLRLWIRKGPFCRRIRTTGLVLGPVHSVLGINVYDPEQPLIPDWKGSLLAGALKAGYLSRLILDGDAIVGEERYLKGHFGKIRDVRIGPNGAVWLLTDSDNGLLIRITESE